MDKKNNSDNIIFLQNLHPYLMQESLIRITFLYPCNLGHNPKIRYTLHFHITDKNARIFTNSKEKC